jgi:hypothetical protein
MLPVVCAVIVLVPVAPAVARTHDAGGARASASGAIAFGGLTSRNGPVFIELAKNGRSITRAYAALEVTCTVPEVYKDTFLDYWLKLPVSSGGAFRTSYSDSDPMDGGSLELASSISGKVNRARTKITGTWTTKEVVRRADGSVESSCDSGPLRFSVTR